MGMHSDGDDGDDGDDVVDVVGVESRGIEVRLP